MKLYDTVRQAGKFVSKVAAEIIENEPRLSKKVNELRRTYDELRQDVETQFDQIEQDLWDWISTMQREAQRYQTQHERMEQSSRK